MTKLRTDFARDPFSVTLPHFLKRKLTIDEEARANFDPQIHFPNVRKVQEPRTQSMPPMGEQASNLQSHYLLPPRGPRAANWDW